MLRLGGKVIGFAGAQLASVTKGESIADVEDRVQLRGRGRHPSPKEGCRAGGLPRRIRAGDQRQRRRATCTHAGRWPT